MLVSAVGSPPQPRRPVGSPRPTGREHVLPSPLRVLAELSLPHVVDGTKTELVGARGHQALDHHGGSLGVHAGQEHGPGGIYKDRGWTQRWTDIPGAVFLTPSPVWASRGAPPPTQSGRGWPRHFPGSPSPTCPRGLEGPGEGARTHGNRDGRCLFYLFSPPLESMSSRQTVLKMPLKQGLLILHVPVWRLKKKKSRHGLGGSGEAGPESRTSQT